MFVLKLYIQRFRNMMVKISRDREQRADSLAAITCGTQSAIEALRKTYSYGQVFETVSRVDLTGKYRDGSGMINYYDIFRNSLGDFQGQIKQQLQYAMNQKSTIHDTHPTLSERIAYLPDIPDKYDNNQLASTLLKNQERYERILSDEFSKFLNEA